LEILSRARASFAEHLARNPYPGRGLVVGRGEDGAWLLVYWIMGRSESSRARRFVVEGTTLRTEPTEPEKLERPELLVYDAMLELPGLHVVGNGDQVRTVGDALAAGGRFDDALATREREPDAPNYTPRITALLDLRGTEPALALSILKANAADPERSDRATYRPAPPPPGLGRALTTYRGDGRPLPSFEGEPLWLPLEGAPQAVLERYWEALHAGNRVALAVKRVGGRPSVAAPFWVCNAHGP
jgi:IMP cyclohydrolase